MEKQTKKALLIALCAVLLLGAAAVAYQLLGDREAPNKAPAARPSASESEPSVSVSHAGADGSELPAAPQALSDTAKTVHSEAQASAAMSPANAPDITLINNKGENISLHSLIGKTVVINFWASWCPPCQREFGDIQNFYDSHKDESDFYLMSINITSGDSREKADAFIKSQGCTLPYFYDVDGAAAAAYQVVSIPLTVTVNADGKICSHHIGIISRSELEALYQKALRSVSAAEKR